jgi:lipoprotein NlpI
MPAFASIVGRLEECSASRNRALGRVEASLLSISSTSFASQGRSPPGCCPLPDCYNASSGSTDKSSMGATMRFTTFVCSLLCLYTLAPPSRAQQTDGLLKQARLLIAEHKATEAIALIDKVLAKDAKNHQAYMMRGLAEDALERYADAVRDFSKAIDIEPSSPDVYDMRGVAYFKLGDMEKSLADFDKFIVLRPKALPYHWRRGICCYYAGKFDEGNRQFEIHQTVNDNDVENAVWRYLCQARLVGRDKARANLLKIERDNRVPMMEVYALFQGRAKEEDVLKAAGAPARNPTFAKQQKFYAHLYLGLYYESQGDEKRAREHIDLAAGEFRVNGYMGDVARVHRDWLREKDTKKP